MAALATDFDGARCIGQHALFDSHTYADHQQAAALCRTCPVALKCAALVAELREQAVSHRPTGTWAGLLYGGPPQHVPCGTDSAYYRHQRNGETICSPCREAHRKAEQRRRERKRQREAA